jgi:hypothetical protein
MCLKLYVMKVSLRSVPVSLFDYFTDITQSSNHQGLLICGCLCVYKLPVPQIGPWRWAFYVCDTGNNFSYVGVVVMYVALGAY